MEGKQTLCHDSRSVCHFFPLCRPPHVRLFSLASHVPFPPPVSWPIFAPVSYSVMITPAFKHPLFKSLDYCVLYLNFLAIPSLYAHVAKFTLFSVSQFGFVRLTYSFFQYELAFFLFRLFISHFWI